MKLIFISFLNYVFTAEANLPLDGDSNGQNHTTDIPEIEKCDYCNQLLTTSRALIYNPSINPEHRNVRFVTVYRCANIDCLCFTILTRRIDTEEVFPENTETGERRTVPLVILQIRSNEDEASGNISTHDYLPPIEE